MNQAHANDDLRNKALHPLQQLKISIAALSSIPQIRYRAERAGTHLDAAMDSIAAEQKQPELGIKEPGTGTPAMQTPVTVQKPVKVIRAQAISTKTYLETVDEVDAYLAKLKLVLLAALDEGKKARIE